MMTGRDLQSMMAGNPSELLKLIDKGFLRALLEDFTTATGLSANIVTISGHSIFSKADAQKMCRFCRLVRELECKKGLHRCTGSYKRAGEQAALYREANVFRCPAGLVEWVTPIIYDDVHIGSIVCGQVLMWEPEEFFWMELEDMNRGLTDDLQPLIDAARELQVVSADKVQAASNLLGVIANNIVQSVADEIKRENESKYQRTLLEQEQGTRLELEGKLNANNTRYFYDQMHRLEAFINDDDLGHARSVFTVALADVIGDGDDYVYAYTRVFELLMAVSQACVDRGVDPEECTGISVGFCHAEHYATDLEGLGTIAVRTFEQLMAALEKCTKPRKRTVDVMRGYIKAHLGVDFTLADVAESVDLSPYYAGRIFKDDQGLTVMEYATALRMDEAKHLLSNPKYRIEEVSAQLGYSDASYFARVFKKHVGMSPRQYRIDH